MKELDATVTHSPTTSTKTKRDNSYGVVVGKGHYKFWVIAAIILLALWSMFTGSLTLKWSAGNLTRDFDFSTLDDLDVLEVEEREKVVRRMWDVYTHSTTTRLPRFWYDAFHAAYEHLVSDVAGVRDAAVSEIAKMSLHYLNLRTLPIHLKSELNTRGSRKMKQTESKVNTAAGSNQ